MISVGTCRGGENTGEDNGYARPTSVTRPLRAIRTSIP